MGVLSLLVVASALGAFQVSAGPVIPNESLVRGEVVELEALHSSTLNINPPQMLFRMKLRLLSVQDVPSKPNLLTAKSGDTIEVYSRQTLLPGLVGKVIKGSVTFRGDERGGRYWISRIAEERP